MLLTLLVNQNIQLETKYFLLSLYLTTVLLKINFSSWASNTCLAVFIAVLTNQLKPVSQLFNLANQKNPVPDTKIVIFLCSRQLKRTRVIVYRSLPSAVTKWGQILRTLFKGYSRFTRYNYEQVELWRDARLCRLIWDFIYRMCDNEPFHMSHSSIPCRALEYWVRRTNVTNDIL